MRKFLSILLAMGSMTCSANAAWQVEKRADPLTDEVSVRAINPNAEGGELRVECGESSLVVGYVSSRYYGPIGRPLSSQRVTIRVGKALAYEDQSWITLSGRVAGLMGFPGTALASKIHKAAGKVVISPLGHGLVTDIFLPGNEEAIAVAAKACGIQLLERP